MQAFIKLRITPAQVSSLDEAELPQHLYLQDNYTAKK